MTANGEAFTRLLVPLLAGLRQTVCWQRTAGLYAFLVIKISRSDASAAQY
jgi:hypothetical protein